MGWLDWIPGVGKKESAVGDLAVGFRAGQPVYRQRAGLCAEKVAEEAMQAVVAYAAIRLVAKSFSAVPWYAGREMSDGEIQAVNAPDLMAVWSRPNPMESGVQFRELWATYFMLHGEGVLERASMVGKRPTEIYTHEPWRVAPVPGKTGLPVAYEYKGPSGATRRFPVNPVSGDSDIRFIKAANAMDRWRGMAPTWAAARSLDANTAGQEWNAALLQNAAQPSGILSTKDTLTDEQRTRLKEAMDERYSGPRNAGRPMVLDGELFWTQLGLGPHEMSWIEGNRETARQIALAYGVPPMLLGIPGDNTYSNFREARLALYDDTVLPLLSLMADEMNAWLTPAFGSGVLLKFDQDSIEALDYRRERRWERVQSADFLTVDEKRAALGYEPVGAAAGGDLIPVVQQYAGISMPELDPNNPEAAGRRAFGDGSA